jgi:hypothetical protein
MSLLMKFEKYIAKREKDLVFSSEKNAICSLKKYEQIKSNKYCQDMNEGNKALTIRHGFERQRFEYK